MTDKTRTITTYLSILVCFIITILLGFIIYLLCGYVTDECLILRASTSEVRKTSSVSRVDSYTPTDKELYGISGKLKKHKIYNYDGFIEATPEFVKKALYRDDSILDEFKKEFSKVTFVGLIYGNKVSKVIIKVKHEGQLWFTYSIYINNKKSKVVKMDDLGFFMDYHEPSILIKSNYKKPNGNINPYISIDNLSFYNGEVSKKKQRILMNSYILNARRFENLRFVENNKSKGIIVFKGNKVGSKKEIEIRYKVGNNRLN